MADPLVVLIASPLEPAFIDQIRGIDPRIEVLHDPELLPQPRYVSDHTGAPTTRTPDQEARFLDMMRRAEVMFDFDRAHLRDLAAVAPRLRWLQATSAGIGQMVKRIGLDRSSIVLTTASGVHARPLADFCLMAMLMFAKDYARMGALLRRRAHGQDAGDRRPGACGPGSRPPRQATGNARDRHAPLRRPGGRRGKTLRPA